MRLIDSDADVCFYVETWKCNCSGYGVQNVMAVDDISVLPEIPVESLPVVQQLRAEIERLEKSCETWRERTRNLLKDAREKSDDLEKVKKERDAAINDLRVCAIENEADCMYCSHEINGTLCRNCMNGSNWEWRGVKEG